VRRPLAATALLLAALAAVPAHAGRRLESIRGHLSVGYGKLVTSDAPGGSISFSGGVEYPIQPSWTAGIEIGYWLLGTRLVQPEEAVTGAEVDYSTFEVLGLARWRMPSAPLEVAFGPGVVHARADLTTSNPAGFGDLAVEETRPAAGLSLTAIQRREAPVRVGLEIASRAVWLEHDTWTVVAARLAIHY
jgi:hypothetical protein